MFGVDTLRTAFSQALSEIDQLDVTDTEVRDIVARAEDFSSVNTVASSSDGSLEATLDTGGRPFVQMYYEVNDGATVILETSNDESNWRELDSIDTSDNGTDSESDEQFPWLARRYVRARVEDGSGDLLIDLAASR